MAVLCIIGCIFLIFIGMQPPNAIARWVVGGAFAVLACLWFGYKRTRFPGPPEEVLVQLRLADSPAAESPATESYTPAIQPEKA